MGYKKVMTRGRRSKIKNEQEKFLCLFLNGGVGNLGAL
jgi:hypothetical protein